MNKPGKSVGKNMRLQEFARKGGFIFIALPLMLLAWPVGIAMNIVGVSLFYSFLMPVLATFIFIMVFVHWRRHYKI